MAILLPPSPPLQSSPGHPPNSHNLPKAAIFPLANPRKVRHRQDSWQLANPKHTTFPHFSSILPNSSGYSERLTGSQKKNEMDAGHGPETMAQIGGMHRSERKRAPELYPDDVPMHQFAIFRSVLFWETNRLCKKAWKPPVSVCPPIPSCPHLLSNK